jgi:hypothetical protein
MKLEQLHESLFEKGFIAYLGHMVEPGDADIFWVFTANQGAKARALLKRLDRNCHRDVGTSLRKTLNGFYIVSICTEFVPDETDQYIAFSPTEKSCKELALKYLASGAIEKMHRSFIGTKADDIYVSEIKIATDEEIEATIKWLREGDDK